MGSITPPTFLDQLAQVVPLVKPVEIPDCLQRPEYQFCKVGWTRTSLDQLLPEVKDEKTAKSILEQFKVPRGAAWQDQANTYSYSGPGLLEWISLGGNYGVVAGGSWEFEGKQARLFLMDADNPPALAQAGFEDDLPRETTRVKTGRIDPAGGHIYFISDISSTKAHYELPGYCHFKFYASQCVGPGSLHPSGRQYELIDVHPTAFVDSETLTQAILKAVHALAPAKINDVKGMLGVKVNASGAWTAKADQLEDKLRQAKVASIKKNQQAEAETEASYNALKGRNKQPTDIFHDERINHCLRRLTASIISGDASRFEDIISFEGKKGEGEHTLRRAWATALVKLGYSDDLIHKIAKHFDDYNESRTNQQIASIRKFVSEGGTFTTCATLKAYIPMEFCKSCRWSPPGPDTLTTGHGHTNERSDTKKEIDPEITTQAQKIIEDGQFPEFWVKVFLRRHNGDQHVAIAMPAANLTPNIINSHGVAVLQVAGESGDGKSHAVQAVAQQMGQWCDISGLSPMALLYHAGISVLPGMLVVMDDNRPDERQGDIIKRAQTQFKTGYKYKTIIKGKPIELQMPPGVQLLTTEVDADSEEQVLNRTLLLEVEGSPEKDEAIINVNLERLETGDQPLEDTDIVVCQAALDLLKAKTYKVTIPEAKKRIKWLERNKDQRANLRNFNIFHDMILGYAVMRWPCRSNYEDAAGVTHVEATRQDFMDALALYHTVHKQMKSKLTSKELDLLTLVKDHGGRISKEDAQNKLKITRQRLDSLIKGRNGQGGLRGKYPGFYVEESTENESDPGRGAGDYSTRHVKKKYLCLTSIDLGQSNVSGSSQAAEWVED